MIAHYDRKFYYLKYRQGGLCPIAKEKKMWAESPRELHHRCHRTKWAIKKFPLFINSVWNLVAVCHWAHMQWGSYGKISWLEAERREAFLKRHSMIARAVNMED